MSRNLIAAFFLALLISFNPLIISERIAIPVISDSTSNLSCILNFFGFEIDQLRDGIIFCVFSLSFLYVLKAISFKRARNQATLIFLIIILTYIGVLFDPVMLSISDWLIFLIIGIVNSSSDRKNSVIFLMIAILIELWLTLLLMILLVLLYKFLGKDDVVRERLKLILIDSILMSAPLIFLINHFCR